MQTGTVPAMLAQGMREGTVVEIADGDGLRAWLKNEPGEAAVAIAARAALRVLPLIAGHVRDNAASRSAALVLPMFRAVAVVRSAAVWPKPWTGQRAADAYAAIRDADSPTVLHTAAARVAALNAAETIMTAGTAGRSASAAVRAVSGAARAVSTTRADDVWGAVSADVSLLDDGEAPAVLMRRPLWPAEAIPMRAGMPVGTPLMRWVAGVDAAPEYIRDSWDGLKQTLLSLGENWQVWTDWYDDILRGADHPESRPLIEELELARVLIPRSDWKNGPAYVNVLIANLEAKHRARTPKPDEIEPQDPSAVQFRETDHKIDADDLAGRDAIATDPIAHDLHDGALAFARAVHELVSGAPHGSNRPRPLGTIVARLIEATGPTVDATRPGLLIPLAAALQVTLDADAQRERDPDLEGAPLSTDEREAVANANNAYKTWINTDSYLATLEGARLRTAADSMDTHEVDAVVEAAVIEGAATPAAQEAVNDAKKVGPQSQFFNATVLNFIRRGLKIAAVAAAGTTGAVVGGAKVAAWLVANAETIKSLLANHPALLDVAIRLIEVLRHLPLAGL